MLQVARLTPKLLGESADLVGDFLRGQINPDGGFQDRAGRSDLYYTVFGMGALLSLQRELPADSLATYLRQLSSPQSLDLVHVSCLARAWAALPADSRGDCPAEAILRRIESFRAKDGAYNAAADSSHGTVYGCFLALGAYQDLDLPIPNPEAIVKCIDILRADDGGYANDYDMPVGLTPSTAAAATLLRHLGRPVDPSIGQWLLSRCREGGFFATPMAPIPDLLSTATALHALATINVPLDAIREQCLNFVDSLWSPQGSFYGNWGEHNLDCEYTYYGLLALGHLCA